MAAVPCWHARGRTNDEASTRTVGQSPDRRLAPGERAGRPNGALRGDQGAVAHTSAEPNAAFTVNRGAVPHLDDPLFGRAREVIYWYFTKVPRLTAEVRMAEEEKLAAQGGGAR